MQTRMASNSWKPPASIPQGLRVKGYITTPSPLCIYYLLLRTIYLVHLPTCWLGYFLFWIYPLELYVPDINLSSDFWLPTILSHSVQWSFAVQKLFSLMKFHLSIPTLISSLEHPWLCPVGLKHFPYVFFSCFKVSGL